MILLLSALGILLVAAIAVTRAALAAAPDGVEDPAGFHAARGPGEQAGAASAAAAGTGETVLPPMLAERSHSGSWL